jgi:hypothetical protein
LESPKLQPPASGAATIDRHFPCRCSIMIADSRRFDLDQLPAAGG